MPHGGARYWYFPDGYLPEKSADSLLEAHEALMLFNTALVPAHVELDIYFDDRDPVKDIPIEVGAERVRCIRLDKPEQLAGLLIPPMTQYALRVRSDINIVVMFGRLDTTQPNLALYPCMGYFEREDE
ncbi:MAG: sensory rhodopsin transducer [Armatimonadota bacterium]